MRNAHSARISISIAMLLLGGAFFSAEALTPQQCAANYQVAIAQANAQLQTAIRTRLILTIHVLIDYRFDQSRKLFPRQVVHSLNKMTSINGPSPIGKGRTTEANFYSP
jgi:hypothetical protein